MTILLRIALWEKPEPLGLMATSPCTRIDPAYIAKGVQHQAAANQLQVRLQHFFSQRLQEHIRGILRSDEVILYLNTTSASRFANSGYGAGRSSVTALPR